MSEMGTVLKNCEMGTVLTDNRGQSSKTAKTVPIFSFLYIQKQTGQMTRKIILYF